MQLLTCQSYHEAFEYQIYVSCGFYGRKMTFVFVMIAMRKYSFLGKTEGCWNSER